MFLLYHAYVYLEFLILACTIYILAPTSVTNKSNLNIIIFESNYEMKKSKARKGEEDKRELCQRISKFHSYLHEMKTKYAPKSVEDSDWSPLFKLAVDDFETVDYYYELFILESTEEEQKKIYEELKKEIETIERRHFNYRIAEGEQRVAEKRAV